MGDTKSKVISIKGKCKWARVHEPRKTWDAEKNGGPDSTWEIEVECSDELFGKLKKTGIHPATKLREYEGETEKYLKLRASAVKTTRNGEVIKFDNIPVVNMKQQTMADQIGNGSEVNCIVELVPVGVCTAMRLKCVQVLSLVPYEGKSESFGNLLEGTKEEQTIVDALSADDDVFL